MLRSIFRFLFKKNGWTINTEIPKNISSCILLAGPHTSNWDTVYAIPSLEILKVNARIAIKKEIMFFPVGNLLRGVGAIPVDRKPKKSKNRITAVDAMANLFKTNKDLVLMISPEGTRTKVKKWRTGFYYIAKQANVPIICSYLDYKNKIAGIGPVFYPTEDLDSVMKKVQEFYSSIPGKFPEKFDTSL